MVGTPSWIGHWQRDLTLQVMNACEQGCIRVCGVLNLFNLVGCFKIIVTNTNLVVKASTELK